MDVRDCHVGAGKEHFWFRGKRGLMDMLLASVSDGKDQTILDIGAGTGDDLSCIAKHGKVYALDVDQQALDLIDSALVVEKRQASACDMPYNDGHFNSAVAFDVLEHVEDDTKMVDEIIRVLKPGGYFIFTVPAFNWLFSSHDRTLGHYRRYNKQMVKALLNHKMQQVQLGYWCFSMFLPAVGQRLLTKHTKTSKIAMFPKPINHIGYGIMNLENWLLKQGAKFPFGLTVYGVYQKHR